MGWCEQDREIKQINANERKNMHTSSVDTIRLILGNGLGGTGRLNGLGKVERSGQMERLWGSRESNWTMMVQRCYLRHCFSSLTHSHQQLHHCYFDSWSSAVSSWIAGSPSFQSSLRMWAGVWHWESAGHSCSLSTKTSMWHLRVLPDEPPQAATALPFKMRPWGPCSERRHLSLHHWGSLHLFFPPTCVLLSVLGC